MTVEYDYETRMIGVSCPNCDDIVEYDVPAFTEAINLGNYLECSDCKCVFSIELNCQTRAAEQPRAVVQPAIELLRRLKEWDQLPSTSDGNYWIKEIDAVLRTAGGN